MLVDEHVIVLDGEAPALEPVDLDEDLARRPRPGRGPLEDVASVGADPLALGLGHRPWLLHDPRQPELPAWHDVFRREQRDDVADLHGSREGFDLQPAVRI